MNYEYKNLITLEESFSLSASNIKELYAECVSKELVKLFSFFSFSNDVPISSSGCYINLKNGSKILDITGGIGVLNHGHNHPEIIKARIKYQENLRMEVHKNYLSPIYAALAKNIKTITPNGLDISFFPSSGSEAVEGCLKMAYKYSNPNYKNPKRNVVLHAKESFHGKLLGAGSITGSPELNYIFPGPFLKGSFRRNNIKDVYSLIEKYSSNKKTKIFAIIYEPFSASLCEESPTEFLEKLRVISKKYDIPLIFDEVYTGLFKTGELFNFMRTNIVPDLVTFAKSFGGGKSSIAGYIANKNIFKKSYGSSKYATLHSTTYAGLGEEAATAIKSIEIAIKDDYRSKSKDIGKKLKTILQNINTHSKIIKNISGSGALWAVEINPLKIASLVPIASLDFRFAQKLATALIIEKLYSEYKILSFFGSNNKIKLIISLPLIATDLEINKLKVALENVFMNKTHLNRLFVQKTIKQLIKSFKI
tara:strand:- start:24046 stop:25482 length:1437 start_codon:yes stop_codon:yes gene_type:complete